MKYIPHPAPVLSFSPAKISTTTNKSLESISHSSYAQFITDAYENALKNLLEINTVPCSLEEYNKTGLLSDSDSWMIRAGSGYHTPWTRDASLNTWNAACFLEPEVAKTTLLAVCERSNGKLYFQLDNQSWDKIVWAIGAWQYYLATGDREFLQTAYEIIKNSLEVLEKEQYNEHFGLFTGGSFFNDGISGYPKDLHEPENPSSFVGDHPAPKHIMTLSTNCLYYQAYCILGKMTAELYGLAHKKSEHTTHYFKYHCPAPQNSPE